MTVINIMSLPVPKTRELVPGAIVMYEYTPHDPTLSRPKKVRCRAQIIRQLPCDMYEIQILNDLSPTVRVKRRSISPLMGIVK